jgi:hypothetical protein
LEHLNALVVMAQAAPLPVDVTDLVKLGPGYAFATYMLWLWGKERDRNDKLIEAHKAEIAAERSRSDQITEKRITDQQVLIPLAGAMTQTSQSMAALVEKLAHK